MEDGLTPPLIFVHKRGLAKLELKVHVIQTLIKPLLLILYKTGFLVPSKSGLQTVWGFVILPLDLGVLPLTHRLEKPDRDLCCAFQLFDTDPLPCYWPFWTEFIGIGHSCSTLCGSECAFGPATSLPTAQKQEGCRKPLTGNVRTHSQHHVLSTLVDLSSRSRPEGTAETRVTMNGMAWGLGGWVALTSGT